jgi:hypothetical protein
MHLTLALSFVLLVILARSFPGRRRELASGSSRQVSYVLSVLRREDGQIRLHLTFHDRMPRKGSSGLHKALSSPRGVLGPRDPDRRADGAARASQEVILP